KSDPAAAEIVGFAQGPPMDHRSRISDRNNVVRPVFSDAPHVFHHFACRHVQAGENLALLTMSGRQHLDVRAANIDHQNFRYFLRDSFHNFSGSAVGAFSKTSTHSRKRVEIWAMAASAEI